MAYVNKQKALVNDITMINCDISDLRGGLSDLKATTTETTDIINDTRATILSMAEAFNEMKQRVDALEAKASNGHKAPTHWEGKL